MPHMPLGPKTISPRQRAAIMAQVKGRGAPRRPAGLPAPPQAAMGGMRPIAALASGMAKKPMSGVTASGA